MRRRPLPRPFPTTPPPGPFRPGFWRSPLRGTWLTSVLGAWLLVAIPAIAITGLLSQVAYEPRLGANRLTGSSFFDVLLFGWPTRPSWLYAATQGIHVTVGIVTVPILLAKLWSVIPKLFEWPPLRSAAHALERLSLVMLVGGGLFEFATGILNTQLYYPWRFSFVAAHYYGAWVFLAGFVLHVGVKLAPTIRTLRARGLAPLRDSLAHTRAETFLEAAGAASTTVAIDPAPATISRRGMLAGVAASAAGLLVLTAGQSIGGPLRRLALLAPHGRVPGSGPNGFQVNKTAASVGIRPSSTGSSWRLTLHGPAGRTRLSRAQLLAMPQHSARLPIACVEGWSTTQEWTGVRLADLAARAGAGGAHELLVGSLQKGGSFRRATLSHAQFSDADALLALRVNGADLSLDHGFPARVIVPALPGVHCTKWVTMLRFGGGV